MLSYLGQIVPTYLAVLICIPEGAKKFKSKIHKMLADKRLFCVSMEIRLIDLFLFVSSMQEDTDPDKLKPYKKDLEYLDDHFQVITHYLHTSINSLLNRHLASVIHDCLKTDCLKTLMCVLRLYYYNMSVVYF